jgi:chloramphenicol-sensitive protein RarD
MRRWSTIRELVKRPATMGAITIAAVLIAINWCTYIYGVNADRVVETSLGYFITPLFVILLGVVVLHERLRPAQWAAVGIGAIAVVVLTVDYGRLPWIALTLAASFGLYGFVKKRLGLPAADGLLLESGVLFLPCLAYLGVLVGTGESSFGTAGTTHTLLLLASGAATAGPLLLFAGAANRLPLYSVGMLQYVAPVLQFSLGVFLFHEPMPPARWAGFGIVWIALAVFSMDGLWAARRSSRLVHVAA